MNPKFMSLRSAKHYQAITIYLACLGWSASQSTDGFIPTALLTYYGGTKNHATQLEAVELWIPTVGGWDINGWHDYQPSSEELAAKRRTYKIRSAKANCRRWHNKTCRCWQAIDGTNS
jgi:hypothetical protein